jgi:ubiquinone/menaquinone biosynthesis C-methylase UbiE
MSNADYYNQYWSRGLHGAKRQGYFDAMVRWLHRMTPNVPATNCRVLEAGCGSASFTPLLAQIAGESGSVIATDVADDQLEKNRREYPGIHFEHADLQQPLRFESDYFDVVWCSEVLEHLYFPHIAVVEFLRVLKPGGQLLVTVPFHGRLKNVIIAMAKFDHHYDPYYSHVRFFTRNTLRTVLSRSGFRDIEISTCGLGRPLRDLFIKTNLLASARK